MEEEISKPNFEQNEQEPEDILSFEEFTRREPLSSQTPDVKTARYNNFPIFFFDRGMAAPIYRKTDFFQRFQKEHPDLEEKLRKGIAEGFDRHEASPWCGFEHELHDAYEIMRSYGASDKDLFT